MLKKIITINKKFLVVLFFLATLLNAQTKIADYLNATHEKHNYPTLPLTSITKFDFNRFDNTNLKGIDLTIDQKKLINPDEYYFSNDSLDYEYIPWESRGKFWISATELAIVEFIPFALAKWGRKWENPEDNWANVSLNTWWRNISQGWEYDGDAFPIINI